LYIDMHRCITLTCVDMFNRFERRVRLDQKL
jgi:hypothetical protein